MEKKNIIIVGGGFAGMSAAGVLAKRRDLLAEGFGIVLIDKKADSEFLPVLPDVVGCRIPEEDIEEDLKSFCRRRGIRFLRGEVKEVDASARSLIYDRGSIKYEYLIIACGSETNFIGDTNLAENCLKLDSVQDALMLRDECSRRAATGRVVNVVVAGGGYTGAEIAGNINRFFSLAGKECSVEMVEKGPDILMMLPGWIRDSVKAELDRLEIKITCEDSVESYDGNEAVLASGRKIDNALCVWSAGVRPPLFTEKLPGEKERGRIKVDRALRIRGHEGANIFITGDAAAFSMAGSEHPLRMAVMFAMGEGRVAARNVINSIKSKPLEEYRALDLGYLVPLATGRAPGIVMGMPIKGRLGYFMHYLMCAYRSRWPNNIALLKDLLFNNIISGK